MSEPTTGAPEPEPIRIPEEDLDDLASALARTITEVRQHGVLLDRLGTDPFGGEEPNSSGTEPEGPASLFILATGGAEYAAELAALGNWVTHVLLPAYGPEISSTRPWCRTGTSTRGPSPVSTDYGSPGNS